MSAKVILVIETSLELRGNGVDDPYRRVTQYWSLDGKLLAEVDPLPQHKDCTEEVVKKLRELHRRRGREARS